MPAPATVDELLELVVKSGVTDDTRLKAYAQKLAEEGSLPSDPSKMAGQLVRDGHLTYFQAEQLLQGKWKRFTIGKYKVLERLGAGGMGQVFLCEHKFMRRRVAVKVLPTAKAEDPASLERFYREARAVAAVDHPNLVRAYDIDQDDNLHFLVMEYVDGTNLQDLIKKTGPLEIHRACHYIYGSAIGLQHAHEVGLVHRDIKPGNILVDRSGVVKIIDLGLARFFHDEDDALTKKYDENVLGTADYLAPEQALESHTVDIRADIYSLGATFYFLLTGSAPFPEGSVAQKLIWHQTRTPKAISAIRPDVPEDIIAVVDKMMAKDAANRYQTPAEVMSALAQRVAVPIPPPSDRELPTLSPAAAGGGQGLRPPSSTSTTQLVNRQGSQPITFSGTSAPTSHGSWQGSTSSPTLPSMVTAAPTVEAGLPGGVWEGLASETQDLENSDTERPALVSAPRSSRVMTSTVAETRKVARKRTVPIWVWVGGAVGLAVVAVAVLLSMGKSSTPPVVDPQNPGSVPGSVRTPRPLFVSKEHGENTFPTLQRALTLARPGDRIEIKEAIIAESPTTLPLRIGGPNLKDVVITSNLLGNAPASIELNGGDLSNPALAMIELQNADGLTLQNIQIQGNGRYNTGIVMTGNCQGTKLVDVAIRGTLTGVRLEDAVGTPERPITIERLDVQLNAKSDFGIALMARPDKGVRNVQIEYSRFEGLSVVTKSNGKDVYNIPKGTAIRIDGPCENVTILQNRIYNCTRGISISELADKGVAQATIENNTFMMLKGGIVIDARAAESRGEYKLLLRRNLFVRVEIIAKHAGSSGILAGFQSEPNNVRDDSPLTKDGNLGFKPITVEGTILNRPSSAGVHDQDFLRYSKDGKLGKGIDIGGERVHVGFWTP